MDELHGFVGRLTSIAQGIGERFLVGGRANEHRSINFDSLKQLKISSLRGREVISKLGVSSIFDSHTAGKLIFDPGFHYDNILHIEHESLRVFTNSLGVQGIVERVLSNTMSQKTIDATFISRARQINISGRENDLVEEVIDGTCAILPRIVSLK